MEGGCRQIRTEIQRALDDPAQSVGSVKDGGYERNLDNS